MKNNKSVRSYFASDVSQSTKEMLKQPPKKYIPIETFTRDAIHQIDLMFYNNIIILSVIDVYSRKGFIHKCSNKKSSSITKAYEAVLKNYASYPQSVQLDAGSEFGRHFNSFLKENNIKKSVVKGNSTQNAKIHFKQGIVERFNGVMRKLIQRFVIEEGKPTPSQKDFDILNEGYNEHFHSTIGCTPNEAYDGQKKPKRKMYKYNVLKSDRIVQYKEGDKVRILLQYPVMMKNRKTKRNYSKDVFEVLERDGHTYKLSDGTGEYYPYTRLMRTRTKK